MKDPNQLHLPNIPVTHMRALSGTGSLTLCGESDFGRLRLWGLPEDQITEHWSAVSCPACLRLSGLTQPQPNSHYDIGGISTIDVIRAKLPPEQYQGFLLGNAIKYSLRLNWKGSQLRDAQKLAEYSNWLVEHLESIHGE